MLGIHFQQSRVVQVEDVFNRLLGGLIPVFLTIGHQSVGDGPADCTNLGHVTTPPSDLDVQTGKSLLVQNGFPQLVLQRAWLDHLQALPGRLDEAAAAFAVPPAVAISLSPKTSRTAGTLGQQTRAAPLPSGPAPGRGLKLYKHLFYPEPNASLWLEVESSLLSSSIPISCS